MAEAKNVHDSLKLFTESIEDLFSSPHGSRGNLSAKELLVDDLGTAQDALTDQNGKPSSDDYRKKYEASRHDSQKEKQALKETLAALSHSMSDLIDMEEEKKLSPILKKSSTLEVPGSLGFEKHAQATSFI